MGHAGSDHEAAYRTPGEILADLERDPLLGTAKLLVHAGCLTPADVLDMYEDKRAEVRELAEEVSELPQLTSTAAVMKPITDALAEAATTTSAGATRTAAEEYGEPLTLARAINRALSDVLTDYPEAMVFGQDVARKGGVYGVTRGLLKKAGATRVFDTVLDEQAILGLALGAGVAGMLPIPEIQYLAYLHNAADQIRGEVPPCNSSRTASTGTRWSCGSPAYGYQKGFGGHFHNDNAIAALRDIPGVIIASPRGPTTQPRCCAPAPRRHAQRGTVRVPRTHRALPHPGPVRRRATTGGSPRYPGSRGCRSALPAPTATAPT